MQVLFSLAKGIVQKSAYMTIMGIVSMFLTSGNKVDDILLMHAQSYQDSATHSSIFVLKFLLTEKPGGLQFVGLQSPDMIEHA